MKESGTEFFNRVNKIADEPTRARELWAENNSRVPAILKLALDPTIKWLLPDGDPPYKPNEDVVNSIPNFWSEVRRLYLFIEGGSPNLTDAKRQMAFIQSLEYVYPADAELLLAVKDRKWPYDNITAELCNKIWAGLIPIETTPAPVAPVAPVVEEDQVPILKLKKRTKEENKA